MKSMRILVALLCILWAGNVVAQQQGVTASDQSQQVGQVGQGQQGGQTQQMGQLIARADRLKGSAVVTPQGQNLGKVDHVALDLQNGKISYIAIDVGAGNKVVPVPYSMFGVLRNDQLVLNMDKNRLNQAPGFSRGSQPNWADANFRDGVAGFWGTPPSGIMTGQAPGTTSQPAPMGSRQQ